MHLTVIVRVEGQSCVVIIVGVSCNGVGVLSEVFGWLVAVGGRCEGELLMVCTSQHVCTLNAEWRRNYGAEQAGVRQAKVSKVGHQ